MLIHQGIEIHDLSLYIPKSKALVIGDLHIGFEEALNKQGVLIPRLQFKETYSKISALLEKLTPKKVILVGDVKHEFSTISNQEWNNLLKIFDLIKQHSGLIIIKGNHDTILKPVAERRNIKVVSSYSLGNIQFLHGDIIRRGLKPIVVIAHEHPAISFKERPTEKFKCFLKGKFKSSVLIIMPSFNQISEGSDITKNHPLSPFLKEANINNFEVWVIQDKPYYFGRLKTLIKDYSRIMTKRKVYKDVC
ncbi:MAG TPA: metallophosphoesterase [Candidatus Nanoarchaeia archaeon]|nr:metallophosphoesterase [Candidatus Nanoarchaeia archaeon]